MVSILPFIPYLITVLTFLEISFSFRETYQVSQVFKGLKALNYILALFLVVRAMGFLTIQKKVCPGYTWVDGTVRAYMLGRVAKYVRKGFLPIDHNARPIRSIFAA